MGFKRIIFCTLLLISLSAAMILCAPAAAATAGEQESHIGTILPWWTSLPFIGILLSIALCPLLVPRFWHLHYGKVSAFWALLFSIPFMYAFPEIAPHEILYVLLIDYVPFIILLWGLYTIAGGIVITGRFSGTPLNNTGLLLMGTLLASWVGTMGASMVMIRPVLRANKHRRFKVHIVCFFIFLIANIGGSLTPLGDPPLFLGFLHGVPFFWVTTAIVPHMLFATAILLLIFFIVDTVYFRKEKEEEIESELHKTVFLKIEGRRNIILLAGVISMVVMSGYWKAGSFHIQGMEIQWQNVVRDVMIILLGIISLVITPERHRKANDFGWFPIVEVAKLFVGIFVTIIPVLAILKAGKDGAASGFIALVKEPYHYYWASGVLSSFLDNAPTYLTFFNLALGQLGIPAGMVPAALSHNTAFTNAAFAGFLKGISVGAVFMGANTYIGNAPNFMVRSLAKEFGVPMPSFFGYMFKYSIPILLPVFIIITFVFF